MNRPFGIISSIAASTTGYIPGTIFLVRARTVSLTVRITCGAALDTDPEIDVFYSPDGSTWDTIPFTYFTMPKTAGQTIQKTVIVDPPEHGYLRLTVVNKSAADVISDVTTFYTIQAYNPQPAEQHGAIDIDRSVT